MATIDLSQFILSANNSGKKKLTPSEQLGLAYKQQNQFAESSTRAYQQAMAQGSAAAIPLAFAMGIERRRANEALGQYKQAQAKEAEDRDMMRQQFAANLPKDKQGLFANMSPEMQDKVIPEIIKSQFTSKPLKTQVIKTDSGIFNYNPTDGTTTPITGPDGNQLQVPQKKGDSKRDVFKDSTTLRKEFTNLSKDFVKQSTAYGRVKASAKNPTAAGDMALLFNYMKVLDPGSVVRESEFATAARSGSFGDRIAGAANKIATGQRLSAKIRKDFVDRSKKLYISAEKAHKQLRKEYRGIAKRNQIPISDVLIESRMPMEEEEIKMTPMPSGAIEILSITTE